ncbi:hypothetical protein Q4Y15_000955 [Campylobacter fetus]|uniref:Uncharacterized protein n=4 Tax=Campylobacter fetus TaxID=196 RepID=A0AAE6IX19_CAMFE|nr:MULTISPECIES: hypothetical protein [Campylobacter]OCS22433.1 hypothetical protein CFVI97532_03945 [Campylobacter fetus subsp. venerealis cfvi97/532]OCS26431.1 hypothetical protein CFVB10_03700 [Campylobacter fetus subsp. venerealis cfvB10]OCS29828.1 hypothetical protein CFVCCUG33900_03930 [Campylobacter fetus subsp. venerealis LMG 6570 = CCUG 33900]OCS39197.1 hypothetical protein CFVI02298_09635 [Campylobacter fetus subsp. venerealis cfvi02/298]ABK82069.1 conserved hypothetical protein [Cam
MNYKFHFLSVFREIFIPHHRSLEFRAKVLAAMLCAKKTVLQSDYNDIKDIATEIYINDERRVGVLVQTVKEYVQKVKEFSYISLDSLLIDIDYNLKNLRRYAKKIDFAHLRRLMIDSDEDDALLQQRVYEYFLSEVRRYS